MNNKASKTIKKQHTRHSSITMKKNTKNMSSLLKKTLCCGGKNFPTDLPDKGRVRVYVGKEAPSKFEVEANYLNHPLFENLLQLSGDEFGYSYNGALRIACEIDLFQHLLEFLKTRNSLAHYMELQDLISKFYNTKRSRKDTQSH